MHVIDGEELRKHAPSNGAAETRQGSGVLDAKADHVESSGSTEFHEDADNLFKLLAQFSHEVNENDVSAKHEDVTRAAEATNNERTERMTKPKVNSKTKKAKQKDEKFNAKQLKIVMQQAARGDAEAQYQLGIMYSLGAHGVLQDSRVAHSYVRKAFDQGHGASISILAEIYYFGRGVAQNLQIARQFHLFSLPNFPIDLFSFIVRPGKLYRRAAKHGYADAQFNLFVMYMKGEGGSKNQTKARAWLEVIKPFEFGSKVFLIRNFIAAFNSYHPTESRCQFT